MLPKTHIILGAIFSLIVFLAFKIPIYGTILIFLSSFLIDFDHYLEPVMKNHSLSLKKAFDYHIQQGKIALIEREKGIRKRGDFHIFHTIEFLLLTFLLGLIWDPFIYVFIGMVFHSFLDLIYLIQRDIFYRRKFLLTNWLAKKLR